MRPREDESQRFPLSVRDEGNRSRSYGYYTYGGMISATDLGGVNGWQYSYGLTKSAQITWDAESGEVGVVPVDARANAYEFSAKGQQARDRRERRAERQHFSSELSTVRTPLGDVTRYERDTAGPQGADAPSPLQQLSLAINPCKRSKS